MASNISIGLRVDQTLEDIKQALSPIVDDLNIQGVVTDYRGNVSEYPVLPADSSLLSTKHPNAPLAANVLLLDLIRVQSVAIAKLLERVESLEDQVTKRGAKSK